MYLMADSIARRRIINTMFLGHCLDIPVVIDCQIHCDDKVFPMVSPGASISDAFDDTDLKI